MTMTVRRLAPLLATVPKLCASRMGDATLYAPKLSPLKRHWSQSTMTIATPPRVKVSYGEKLAHFTFMMVVWTAPCLYFLSQIKVWRKTYYGEEE